ncbi:MAG: GNAT family N-acetyltransferase [Nitrospirae bacterium]|nr:GNAT family N-acetyltransferase [Nitrospirota bacterium]
MHCNIKIRPSAEPDEEGIRELFRICFGKELSHEEWLWKYKKLYPGSSSIVAEDSGKIIAHYGGFKMQFYSKGRIFSGYQGCDVMTHPGYRAKFFTKKGITVKTAGAFYEANPAEFIFGFPSERHGRLMTLQLGWEPYRFVSVLYKDINVFSDTKDNFFRFKSGWEFLKSKEMDRLWEDCKDLFNMTVYKESRYILWRYKENPSKKYEVLMMSEGLIRKRLKALVIFNINNKEMLILDFFVSKDVNELKVFLNLENIAAQKGLHKIRLWINPVEKLYQGLKDAGYREEKGIPYSIKVFNRSDLPPDFFMNNYCYKPGDYDAA